MFQYKKVIFLSFLLIINLVKSQTPEEIQETALAAITKPLISAPNVKIKRLSDFGYVAT